ncbi:hypothetical protein B0H14DRAFT_1303611 [Mycena olivaceomarginata]|nr:hypothetical protein B0H14DRAFT_1303611 [Mycena olivaceomarginata]
MSTTTAMCTGHSFQASTILQWYQASSSQRCSGSLAASSSSFHVCALIGMRVPPISLPVHISRPPMCLFPDVLVTSLPLIPASRFTLRSFARPRPLLPHVSPASVLYPVRRSRWSSSPSDPLLQINLLNSVLGCATGQCMLNYSHVIVEFMSQPGRRLLSQDASTWNEPASSSSPSRRWTWRAIGSSQ